jgi:hypothetical protein
MVALFDADADNWNDDQVADFALDDELVELLDEVFLNAVPAARRLLRLLQERGWTGWTKLERTRNPHNGPPSTTTDPRRNL